MKALSALLLQSQGTEQPTLALGRKTMLLTSKKEVKSSPWGRSMLPASRLPAGHVGWHCTKSLPYLGSVSSTLPPASPVVIHLRVAGLRVWVLVIDIKTCPWVLEDKLGTWRLITLATKPHCPYFMPVLHSLRLSRLQSHLHVSPWWASTLYLAALGLPCTDTAAQTSSHSTPPCTKLT